MRNALVIMVMIGILAGCGGQQQEDSKQMMMKTSPSQTNYMAQGMQYLEESDIARAIQNFDMAIKQDPTNVDTYLLLGQVYMRLKNFERAADTFQAATRIAPNNGDVYYFLALSRASQEDNRLSEALQAAKKSAEIYVALQDKEKLARSLVLVKSLTERQMAQGVQADK